jgi:hypothetical protein
MEYDDRTSDSGGVYFQTKPHARTSEAGKKPGTNDHIIIL